MLWREKYLKLYFFLVFNFIFIYNSSIGKNRYEEIWQVQDDIRPKHGFIIIPSPPPHIKDPITLKSEDVDILVKDGTAKIQKTQIFHNNCFSTVEGIYAFPLPEGSVISDFAMYMGTQKVNGQVLSASEARKIYEEIVRKRRDPAILEYMGQSLFQARIFPITANEDKRIDLNYNQILKFENNSYRFIYPLVIPEKGKSAKLINLNIKINSSMPVTNIYSPTHKIKINQINEKEASVALSLENQPSDKDLILYYTVSDDKIGVNLINYRPYSNDKGFYCLNLSPKYEINKSDYIAKDIIFVLDASGSMLGEKITQAKEALKYCMNNLNKGDRFALIDFSNDVRKLNETFLDFNEKSKEDANYYISKIEATGGTNLNEAVLTGLKMKKEGNSRPTMLILLTDGLPTVGVKNPSEIISNIQKANNDNIRMFTFGVGFDVDAFLLDKISGDNSGSSNYVKPGENLETEVSSFFSKISTPVLSDIKITYEGIEVMETYPKKISDLFYKSSLTVFGLYDKGGEAKINIQGKVGKKIQKFSFPVNFQEIERENDFVAALWANRKVGYLLDQIRMNGENKEMVDEIIRLAKKYGIVTPYTSYLVTEEEGGRIGMNRPIIEQNHLFDKKVGIYRSVDESTKENMVAQSITIQNMQTSNQINQSSIFKSIKGKTFILKNDIWKDLEVDENNSQLIVNIKFADDEYFDILKKYPEIKDFLKLGDKILFKYKDKIYKIE